MEIKYTSHLEFRLKVRDIPHELPREIYFTSQEHYNDKVTRHFIAVSRVKYLGKLREMAVSYDNLGHKIEIITIHPIHSAQKLSRIQSGRWIKYDKTNK